MLELDECFRDSRTDLLSQSGESEVEGHQSYRETLLKMTLKMSKGKKNDFLGLKKKSQSHHTVIATSSWAVSWGRLKPIRLVCTVD